MEATFTIRRLGPDDADALRQMLDVFGRAFDDEATYTRAQPSEEYLAHLLGSDSFVCVVALHEGRVIGGIGAYELRKFEQERSEIYIYDLAVDREYRRRGVATALIDEVRRIAAERGAWVVYVQADRGDDPAIELYSKLGVREDVYHFDFTPGE